MLDKKEIERLLAIKDLSEPENGHAISLILDEIINSLVNLWNTQSIIKRGSKIVSIEDNYNRLGYPIDGAARDSKYTKYVSKTEILRTQTSSAIPNALDKIYQQYYNNIDYQANNELDLLLVCPGMVYRRDVIDKIHSAQPHQLDLWRITSNNLNNDDLLLMIKTIINSVLPGYQYRLNEVTHPYTNNGLEIEVLYKEQWIEIGECGLASQTVLDNANLNNCQGLAMGLGLDRILMLRKKIDDIRILRNDDPRIKSQMKNLDLYNPVSNQPLAKRDLSLAVNEVDLEVIGDRVQKLLGEKSELVEELEILSITAGSELPIQALERIGMDKNQYNLLLRVKLRHPTLSISKIEGNQIRDLIYRELHQGTIIILS